MSEDIVVTKARPEKEIKAFIRGFMLRPFMIAYFPLLCIYLFFTGANTYRGLPFDLQVLANMFWGPVYYIFLFIVAPKLTVIMVKRRIPFFLGYLASLIVPCVIEITSSFLLFDFERSFSALFGATFYTLVAIAPGLAIILAAFQQRFARGIFIFPPSRFLFLQWKDKVVPIDQVSKYKVAHLRALNQYCEVTFFEKEEIETVRSSLTCAIEKYCPGTEGMRVHRSHWVAYAEIAEVKYICGNPRITLKTGEMIPASREAYNKLKGNYQIADGVLSEVYGGSSFGTVTSRRSPNSKHEVI